MTDLWWTSLVPGADQARARGRKRTARGVASAAVVTALAGLVAANALSGPRTAEVASYDWGQVHRPSVEALALGCSQLVVVSEPSSKIGWVPAEGHPTLPYETTVPAAGWFFPDAPSIEEASPAPEAVLRELWQGRTVAWHAPDASAQVVAELHTLVAENPEWDMRVAAWPQGRERLPGTVAFATWGATQSCDQVSADVAADVLEHGTGAPGRPGQAPDPVVPATA